MAAKRITVHSVEIEDRPGILYGLLAKAAESNVDFLCFAAFSAGGGKGKLYLSAKDVESLKCCAEEACVPTTEMAGFMVCAEDKVGAGAEDLKGLADAGINGVAAAAMVCDGQYQMLVVVDAADGDAAEKAMGG